MKDVDICAWLCISLLTVSLMKGSLFAGVSFFIFAAVVKVKVMGGRCD